jgi:hypothetical protein
MDLSLREFIGVYMLQMDSTGLNAVMQNMRYRPNILFLGSISQEESHVIIKNWKEIVIYMDSERRKICGFYKNYESIP